MILGKNKSILVSTFSLKGGKVCDFFENLEVCCESTSNRKSLVYTLLKSPKQVEHFTSEKFDTPVEKYIYQKKEKFLKFA